MVEAVRRPGARQPHRGGAGAQSQHPDRRRERRAGGGRADANALGTVPAGRLQRRRRPCAHDRGRDNAGDRATHPQPGVVVPGAAQRELGNRPVGAHPPPERVRAREPARHGRSPARRHSLARRVGRDQLPDAAGPGRAARDLEADARGLQRVRAALRAAVQVRPGIADAVVAGPVAIRDRGRADSADRVADRADREFALGAARPQSRTDRARQVGLRPRACRRCPRASRRNS